MSGGGSKGSTTTVEKADPWPGLQGPLLDLYGRAQQQAAKPMQFFPGQTFATPAAETNAAMGLQTERALAGSPITGAMQSELTRTLSGQYLDPATNPGFQTMVDRTRAAVLPGIDSSFSMAGRTGSGLHGRAIGEGLGDAIGSLAYQNYGDERQRQIQGMLFAPTAANQDYYDIAKLAEVGAQREGIQQQIIDDQMARFNFAQQEPWQRLQQYNQLLNGGIALSGGTASTTGTQPRSSLGAGLLGGGLAGAALGSMFGFPLLGAAGGGLLGGVFR